VLAVVHLGVPGSILCQGWVTLRDFRFPPSCKWDRRLFGILRIAEW